MPLNFTKAPPIVKPAVIDQPEPAAVDAAALQTLAKNAAATLFGEPAPEPEPPAEPQPELEPAPAAPAPEPPAEPAPEPEPQPELERPFDTNELISRTARETAEEMRRIEQSDHAAPVDPTTGMSDDDAEEYAVLLFLERQDPKKHAGKAKAFADYVKAVYARQDEWEKENPNKTWNPADAEHADWFAAHPVPVDRRTIDNGLIDMKVEQRFQEKVKPELDRMGAEKTLRTAMPQIGLNVSRGIVKLVTIAAPELASLVTLDGQPNLSSESVAKVHAADPIAATILDATAAELDPILTELEKSVLRDQDGNYPFRLQPERNRVHAKIDAYREEAEENMRRAPAATQVSNGRQWISLAQREAMVKKINQSATGDERTRQLQELNNRHWTLTVDHVIELITDDYGKKAKNLIRQTDELARKKYKPEVAAANPGQPAPAAPAPASRNAPAPAGKPRPPSVSSSTDLVSTPNSGRPLAKTTGEAAADVMFK